MARLNKYISITAGLWGALAMLTGCESELKSPTPDVASQDVYNQFSISKYDYTVELSTKGGLPSYSDVQGDLLCEMTLTPRGAATKSSFDDIVWDKHDSKVGIYIIEHVEEGTDDWNQIANNNHTKVNIVNGDDLKSVNKGLDGNKIQLSSTEILEYIKHYKTDDPWYGKSVDVMAYFPYATEVLSYVALTNNSNSIVGIFNPTDSRNIVKLPFTMKPTQTDDNIWYHDLMVSVRESGSDAEGSMNIYGNVGKFNRSTYNASNNITGYYDMTPEHRTDRGNKITCDNVHLRMQHLFAKFNITFNIDNRFNGETVDRMYVDGAKVYSYGELNMITGVVTPGGSSSINRLIPKKDEVVTGGKPLQTVMLLCPCQLEADGDMVLHLKIGGVEYACDFHKLMKNAEIKACHEYNLTLSFSNSNRLKVTNNYGGTVACVQYCPGDYDKTGTYGERWTIPEATTDYPQARIGSDMANWLVVSPKLGYKMKGIYVNGELVPFNNGSDPLTKPSDGYRIRDNIDEAGGAKMKHYYCKLDVVNNKNSWYEVVYVPEDEWYSQPDHIIQHFDGIYNNGICDPSLASTVPNIAVWKDISGHGRDAQLQNISIDPNATSVNNWRETVYDQVDLGSNIPYTSYETTQQSGWVAGGLKLDGVNDYITFPGALPNNDGDPETGDFNLTIDMYLCIEGPQCGTIPRILSESEAGLRPNTTTYTYTAHGYPSLVVNYKNNQTTSTSNVINLISSSHDKQHIYVMGFGNNYGHPSTGDDLTKFSNFGNEIIHIVVWYRGGYGEITDMNIFSEGNEEKYVTSELGGGDARNCYLIMVEYVEPTAPSVIKRGFLEFYGNDSDEYRLSRWLKTRNGGTNIYASNEYNFRELKEAFIKENAKKGGQGKIDCYLEDAFPPMERWACLGGRKNDYTRQVNATIFSFMMYDTTLTFDEVQKNFALHRKRFGYAKTVIPAPPSGSY